MPFTPFHMGPGALIKSILQGSFSLMVFGWCQILMDLQPLIVLITGEGHLHGFSHTFIGATLISIFAALTGKYLSELGLTILDIATSQRPITILWWVAFLSSFIGGYSHVVLDAIMHTDVEPYFPVAEKNHYHGFLSVGALHKFCLYSALTGAGIYYFVSWRVKKT